MVTAWGSVWTSLESLCYSVDDVRQAQVRVSAAAKGDFQICAHVNMMLRQPRDIEGKAPLSSCWDRGKLQRSTVSCALPAKDPKKLHIPSSRCCMVRTNTESLSQPDTVAPFGH